MIVGWLTAAWAQQPVRLATETDLQPCLDVELCGPVVLELLSESMLEIGYLFQHDGHSGSALGGKGTGFTFELQVQTPVLGEPNLITESVTLPPAVPRIDIGYQVGSFTYDDPFPQFAVSAYAFPPVSLGDYRFGNVGGVVSGAVPVGTHYFWLGAEADLSYGFIRGPFVGDGDVLEDIDQVDALIDVEPPPCDATEAGCIDRFRTLAFVPRLGFSVEPHPAVFLYGKFGLAYVDSTISVAYDASRWRIDGVQPQFSYGAGFRIGDRIQIGLGGVTALKPEAVSTDDSRSMTRVIGSFSVRTGDERYWYEDETDEDAEAPGG